jgi:hypothetical protein
MSRHPTVIDQEPQMNNSKTPKIVIGVGLAAVYAAGLGYFTLRGAHDNVIAQTSTVSTAQIATNGVPPTDSVPASADSSTSAAEQPAATTVAPAEKADVEKSRQSNEDTSAVSEPANSAGDAPSSLQAASAPSGNDSQITADVKSEIAAVAPAGTIDVTTKDGVVELTGSVPSEEVIDRARLAARNVADVRDVDVSALTVSN